MDGLEEGKSYLVGIDGKMRIATFNGFGADKGWGGMDWSGDSGYSTDSWMHEDIDYYLPLERFVIDIDGRINGNTKLVTDVKLKKF